MTGLHACFTCLPTDSVSVHKCAFFVMPDLIRHPDVVPTPYQARGKLQSGTISKTGSRFFTGNPGFRLSPGMTFLIGDGNL
jgi:hypothetical protein